MSKILRGIVFIELCQLKIHCFPPKFVSIPGVEFHGIRMLVFLAELNDLQTWSTDISNSYLEAETNEKVFFVTGPKFGDLARHILLIIVKALHGLHSSGACWHDHFADCL